MKSHWNGVPDNVGQRLCRWAPPARLATAKRGHVLSQMGSFICTFKAAHEQISQDAVPGVPSALWKKKRNTVWRRLPTHLVYLMLIHCACEGTGPSSSVSR